MIGYGGRGGSWRKDRPNSFKVASPAEDRTTLPAWSWENKQPVRDPNAPVTLWQVDAETSVKDPRFNGNEEWPDCEVLTFTARVMGLAVALIATDSVSADLLRRRRGIRSVKPAPDRRYLDDDPPTVVVVSDGGTQWERITP